MKKRKTAGEILDGKGKCVFQIFFRDWFSIRRASFVYNPEYREKAIKKLTESKKKKGWVHPTVKLYFKEFGKRGWLDHKGVFPHTVYRMNMNPFFEYITKESYKNIKHKPKGEVFNEREEKAIEEIFNFQYSRDGVFLISPMEDIRSIVMSDILRKDLRDTLASFTEGERKSLLIKLTMTLHPRMFGLMWVLLDGHPNL